MKLIGCSLLAAAQLAAQFASQPHIDYATYLGAAKSAPSLAVNSSGYAFFVGGSAGGCDIAKVDPTGSTVVCINVPSAAPLAAVALDHSDSIYVVGNTQNGAKAAKLSPDGAQIRYTTVIAGATASLIAADSNGDVYIAGTADGTFVTTPGVYQTQLASGTTTAPFAMKLSETGTVEYATYAGAGNPASIAFDSQGALWMVGFVTGASYVQSSFIEKLSAAGATLLLYARFGGFLDGISSYASGVAVDAQDSAYVAGSAALGVPVTPGVLEPVPPDQQPLAPQNLGYLLKYSAAGNLIYGTYLGSIGQAVTAVAVGGLGNAAVALAGGTRPQSTSCPPFAGLSNTQIQVLNADASTVLLTAYLPRGFDRLVLGPANRQEQAHRSGYQPNVLYAAGSTTGTAFFATPGAYQTLYPASDEVEAALARIDLATPAGPEFDCAVNAASLTSTIFGDVAPGENLSLFGQQFPSGVTVTFDEHPAPILYADSSQINTIVPFEVAGPATNLWLSVGTEKIGLATMPVAPAVPGIFSNGIVNQDGTVNSASHPAAPGSVITVYMTGLGGMTPAIADGAVGPLTAPFPVPILGVGASVGTSYYPTPAEIATVLFAGQAPGLVAGVVQVNIRIPSAAATGASTLSVYVGNYLTQQSIFLNSK